MLKAGGCGCFFSFEGTPIWAGFKGEPMGKHLFVSFWGVPPIEETCEALQFRQVFLESPWMFSCIDHRVQVIAKELEWSLAECSFSSTQYTWLVDGQKLPWPSRAQGLAGHESKVC